MLENFKAFAKQHSEMRRLQRLFFKTKDRKVLAAAKIAEHECDKQFEAIAPLLFPIEEEKEPNLFNQTV